MTKRLCAAWMLAALLGMAQRTAPKQVKNQQEYDLYNAARNEQDPAKKLAALDAWKAKFPDTELKEDQNLFYLSAYLGLEANALKPDARETEQGGKAAHTVLDNLDAIFAASLKPGYIRDADWAAARREAEIRSHWTLANLAIARKDNAEAEAETLAVLKLAPADPNAALLLSRAIIAGGRQERYPEAIYQVARAVAEAPAPQKQALEERLKKMYEGYHGALDGLEQVEATAVKSALPPPGWTVESVTQIAQLQAAAEEKFKKEHPEIVLWRVLRDNLTAAGAEAYFETELKNIELPKLKGRVLGQTSPKELAVLMDYVAPAQPPALADATIHLDGPWKGTLQPGTMIAITGAVAESFSRAPYMLTIKADRKGVQVLDEP